MIGAVVLFTVLGLGIVFGLANSIGQLLKMRRRERELTERLLAEQRALSEILRPARVDVFLGGLRVWTPVSNVPALVEYCAGHLASGECRITTGRWHIDLDADETQQLIAELSTGFDAAVMT